MHKKGVAGNHFMHTHQGCLEAAIEATIETSAQQEDLRPYRSESKSTIKGKACFYPYRAAAAERRGGVVLARQGGCGTWCKT
jgi:hypothetical protein